MASCSSIMCVCSAHAATYFHPTNVQQKAPEARVAQRRLAEEVTELVHGGAVLSPPVRRRCHSLIPPNAWNSLVFRRHLLLTDTRVK